MLNNRTVPLLAIFSALSFTVMMFNIPVPGGNDCARGGGARSLPLCWGHGRRRSPLSTALILQALFFGDGGVLAIFANCLNMGILLPFTGYATYRILAAGSPVLSTRRGRLRQGSVPTSGSPLRRSPWASNSGSSRSSSRTTDTPCIARTELRDKRYRRCSCPRPRRLDRRGLVTGLGVAYLQRRHPGVPHEPPANLGSGRDALTVP